MDDTVTPAEPTVPTPTIQYEETPVITPIPQEQEAAAEPQPEQTMPQEPIEQTEPMAPPIKKKRTIGSVIKGLIIFVFLFIVGYALSGVVRNLITNASTTTKTATPAASPTPIESLTMPFEESTPSSISAISAPAIQTSPTTTLAPSAWKTYNPLHGTTRTALTTIQFQLPSSVSAPVCDGSSCGSQGTYLPGGTRLTVALRGTGEVLADFRGKIISDASGKALATTTTTIAGKKATEYTTDTTGSTAGGYGFSTMHGYMIEVTDTLSFEINHFSPSGITADFTADDTIFKSIVATIGFNPTTQATATTSAF